MCMLGTNKVKVLSEKHSCAHSRHECRTVRIFRFLSGPYIFLESSLTNFIAIYSFQRLYQAAFDQNAREIVQSVISWVPEGLLPESTLKPAEKEALFADYVKFKQNIVAGALNSIYKISHTHSAPHQNIAECVALVTVRAHKNDAISP